MKHFLYVHDCGKSIVQQPLSGNYRTYYIRSQTEIWSYAPSGKNLYDGGSLTEPGRQEISFLFYYQFLPVGPGKERFK